MRMRITHSHNHTPAHKKNVDTHTVHISFVTRTYTQTTPPGQAPDPSKYFPSSVPRVGAYTAAAAHPIASSAVSGVRVRVRVRVRAHDNDCVFVSIRIFANTHLPTLNTPVPIYTHSLTQTDDRLPSPLAPPPASSPPPRSSRERGSTCLDPLRYALSCNDVESVGDIVMDTANAKISCTGWPLHSIGFAGLISVTTCSQVDCGDPIYTHGI